MRRTCSTANGTLRLRITRTRYILAHRSMCSVRSALDFSRNDIALRIAPCPEAVDELARARLVPSSGGGVDATSKKCREATSEGADGVVAHKSMACTRPPRLPL